MTEQEATELQQPRVRRTIRQWLCSHVWLNDRGYPLHGFRETPYPDSYCGKCKVTGDVYNRTVSRWDVL